MTWRDLEERTNRVIEREIDVIRNQLQRNRVELIVGHARFLDQHTLGVALDEGGERQPSADQIIVGSQLGNMDHGDVLRSLALMGQRVLPKFTD